MIFRQAGIRHTDYAATRQLWTLPADRLAIGVLLVFALAAPFVVGSLALSSYLTPWLVWTAAALGLNLILGWAGQFHFGYAAVMGIGAYATVHAFRNGVPWEIANAPSTTAGPSGRLWSQRRLVRVSLRRVHMAASSATRLKSSPFSMPEQTLSWLPRMTTSGRSWRTRSTAWFGLAP